MDKKIVMSEVHSAQELQALTGCTITTVSDAGRGDDEGLCLDCKDNDGNLVSFLILEDGSWHFHNGKKVSISADQFGELALLTSCPDIDSVHFNSANPFTEIVIRSIGPSAADRVLTILKGIFPKLEVREDEWNFKGALYPMYCCSDPNFYFIITIAVMPLNAI